MEPTFDEKELLDRVDHDMAFLAETVGMLQSDGPLLLGKLKESLAANDAPAVGRTAHALKGMLSNFCSPRSWAMALAVETAGRGGDLSAAAPAVQALGDQMDRLLLELAEFVRKGRPCAS